MSHACRPASTRFRQPANSNAAGADWIYGLFGDNPPPIVVESCTFMNFPPQSPRQSAAVGLRATRAAGAAAATPPVSMARVLFDASFTSAWPLARFENASSRVAMAGCILPSAPAAPDFAPDLQEDVLVTNSPVARAGFPLEGSPAALLGVGAFAPLADDPAADADADGLSDHAEAYVHGTDPFLADTDLDGVPDGAELAEGTDPANPANLCFSCVVRLSNPDVHR